MHEPSPFAALLRRYRLAAELTQEGLAERTGLSTQAVGALERGHRKLPYRDTVRALADALDLDAAERLALEHALSQSRQPTVNANIAAPNPAAVPADPPLSQGISRPNFASDQLIGRAAAVAAVAVLLRSAETRLVTMTGPGGVGKTRLATEVARVVAGDFPDGATFVPLASVDDHRLVAATIANAIGARGYATARPEETLRAAIGAQRLLLILDNMEHVLAATPLIADLHAGCPHLTILVTSRAVLRVRGERVYEVPPLALPDANANPAALLDSAAVALFVRRAQEAFPGFALTESNAAAVAAICHRLDRLPLALELAAARLTLLSPAGLRSRLDRALPLLTGGGRDRPERQQTLRAALAWSYELLSPGEQAVFRRLAPFAGGCTVAAAEAVCGADQALAVEILDWLAALLEHGLLRRQPGEEEEPRFALLETVREYAAEQLAANGETASAQRRHAAYFLALAEAESPALTSTAPHQALARLEREHDNLRAALAWLLASPDGGERALRLTGALWRFWLMRGHATQGLDWLMRSLKASQAGGVSDIRARVMGGASALAHSQGDYARAAALGSASLGLWRELGDPEGIAGALGMLALSHHGQGDYAAAIPLAEEALGIWQAQGDQRRAAALLTNLGAITTISGIIRAPNATWPRGWRSSVSWAMCRAWLSRCTTWPSAATTRGRMRVRRSCWWRRWRISGSSVSSRASRIPSTASA